MSDLYAEDNLSAFEAISGAQKIAFAPMAFHAALSLRELGILEYLDERGAAGAEAADIAAAVSLEEYAVSVLLDMGLSMALVCLRNGRYRLAKTGFYLLHDRMTRINMDFAAHVCYQGMAHLTQSLRERRPAGLRVFFNRWSSIYPHLSELPQPARDSWFAFDHFYSDACFRTAIRHVFAHRPRHIYDLGGNTGKFAVRCTQHDEQVRVTIIDLQEQLELARQYIAPMGLDDRISFVAVDVLDPAASLPAEADVWWMSQFLDCFSEEQIVIILTQIRSIMRPRARIFIMEPFWDHQKFEAVSFSLNATSLYFAAIANGRSRFYARGRFLDLIAQAGLQVEREIDGLGICHTLLICTLPAAA